MMIDQKIYTPGDFSYYDVPDNKREYFLTIQKILVKIY